MDKIIDETNKLIHTSLSNLMEAQSSMIDTAAALCLQWTGFVADKTKQLLDSAV